MRPLRWIAWPLVALLPSLLPRPAGAADAAAGVAAAVRGRVSLARVSIPDRSVVSGEDIFMRDSLRSGPSSGMQILLLDETVFTIGPDSAITVDEFVYDPANSAGKISATVAKGVFRFVTGKVAHRRPSDMNVALPSGNIGVRGTIVAGRVDDVTRASLVILLGDSRALGAGTGGTAIDVCNAGECERVATPGFGVRIDGPDAAPGQAFRVDPGELDAILSALGDPEGALANGGGGKLEEGDAPLTSDERDARRKMRDLNALDQLSNRAAQDALGVTPPPPEPVRPPPTAPPQPPPTSPTGTGPGYSP
jgi:hypothetical protein